MTQLPAVVTRPILDAYADALTLPSASPAAVAPDTVVDSALTDGVPTRLLLDASRSLALAVPIGVARVLLDADPLTLVWSAGVSPLVRTPVDLPRPRLTLLVDERIADSTAVVEHTPLLLADRGRAVVEVVVDHLVLTAGTLRGRGRFDSRIVLRWRDLLVASPTGPAAVVGDPALELVGSAS
jgi:hypothetical protein